MTALEERMSRWGDWPVSQLAARKNDLGVAVSVVIPARNEERTVGEVVAAELLLVAERRREHAAVLTGRAKTRAAANPVHNDAGRRRHHSFRMITRASHPAAEPCEADAIV